MAWFCGLSIFNKQMSTSVCEHVVLSASCHLYWIQKNNVCVCVCVGGRGGVSWWGGWSVRACVRAFVCTLLLLSIFLVFERFLAPCSLSC